MEAPGACVLATAASIAAAVGWVERSETHRIIRVGPHARMGSYRRNLVPGGSYFFTVNLAERRLGLLTENIGLLRTAFRHV